MTQPVLQFQKYQIALPDGASGTSRILLEEIELTLKEYESLIIIGASGSGKTLILKSILRLLPSHFLIQGQILYFPTNGEAIAIGSLSESDLTMFRRTQVGFLPQAPSTMFSPVQSCGQQLAEFISLRHSLPPKTARALALEWLQEVGFLEPQKVYRFYPHQLSGGMAQRVGLALALAGKPRLVLVDEPTAALDVIARQEFYSLLARLRTEHNFTLIMVTHDLDSRLSLADKLLVILRGMICEYGPAALIRQNPRHPYTQLLIETNHFLKEGKSSDHNRLTAPSLLSSSAGCPFGQVCPRVSSKCQTQLPESRSLGSEWIVRCHHLNP